MSLIVSSYPLSYNMSIHVPSSSHLVFCILFVMAILNHVTSPTFASGDVGDLAEKIDNFIKTVMDCNRSPALSLAVVKDGQVVISKGYGHTKMDKSQEVTSKTKFAIGSLTKAFTSLLLVKALETKNITLDTPIVKYFPSFKLGDDYLTQHTNLRDILGHRTGLANYDVPFVIGFDPTVTRKDFVWRLKWLESKYSFREKWVYNNLMYVLAADILKQLSDGQEWEDVVQSSIFNRLNMTDSGFLDQVTNASDFALPCAYMSGILVDLSPELFKCFKMIGPAGSIYSTSDDMSKWLMLHQSKDPEFKPSILKTYEASMMTGPFMIRTINKPPYLVSDSGRDYALGWMQGSYRGEIMTHSSVIKMFPDVNAGFYLSVNGPQSTYNLITGINYHISDLLLGLPPWFNSTEACSYPRFPWFKHYKPSRTESGQTKKPAKTDCQNCETLSIYVGKYDHQLFGEASIHLNSSSNNQLNLNTGRFGWMVLTYDSGSTFDGSFYGPMEYINQELIIKIEFSLDENENTVSLTIRTEPEVIGPYLKRPNSDDGTTTTTTADANSQGQFVTSNMTVWLTVTCICAILLQACRPTI